MIRSDGRFVQTRGYCTDIFFVKLKHGLQSARKKIRLFLLPTTNAPHGPLIPPASGDDHYRTALQEAGLKNTKQIDRVALFMQWLKTSIPIWGDYFARLIHSGLQTIHSLFFQQTMDQQRVVVFTTPKCVDQKLPIGVEPVFQHFGNGRSPTEGVHAPQVTAHIDVLPTPASLPVSRCPKPLTTKLKAVLFHYL